MIISFQLSMPNSNTWNGSWSGEGQPYFIIKKLKRHQIGFLKGEQSNNFYYNFEDGWGANVKAEIVDSKESRKRKKASKGFCSYNWMVDEILLHGKILERKERIKARRTKGINDLAPEMFESLIAIINAQFDKKTTLAGLNGAIKKAKQMLIVNGILDYD